MSKPRKLPEPDPIPVERRDTARRDAEATRDLLQAGDVATVVAAIRERFPKVIARLAR